jgi:choline dehydrogenase-like flavoprotein
VSTARKNTDEKATIVKAPRPAHAVQGLRIGGASCFPAFSEHSA